MLKQTASLARGAFCGTDGPEKANTESGGGEITPETLTISNIANITQTAQTEFYIEYSTNIAVAKQRSQQ